MIQGAITERREAIIPLLLKGLNGRERWIRAAIDTGFNGELSLPPDLVNELGYPWRADSRAVLADGSESLLGVHEGVVQWDGDDRHVKVDCENGDPLVGMKLLMGFDLSIRCAVGGAVTIKPIA